MADVINVSSGSQALLALSNVAGLSSVAEDSNAMIVPQLTDITVNNSTGVYRFKTLDNTAESAVTTPYLLTAISTEIGSKSLVVAIIELPGPTTAASV
ncbi:hypothetical protein N9245_00440 [bacterium]|nr:hypothetical protein [bacterium]